MVRKYIVEFSVENQMDPNCPSVPDQDIRHIVHTGKDFHGVGCACGYCNANGHAYGIAVFPTGTDSDDFPTTEPLEIIYGPDETTAENAARAKYSHRRNP